MEPGFSASEIDTSKPHPARMYDAYLGGRDNYAADREAVRQILRDFPEVRAIARANPLEPPWHEHADNDRLETFRQSITDDAEYDITAIEV